MDEDLGEWFRKDALQFVGALVAASAHEYKNHLAVINEFAGLLGDLAASESTDAEALRKRVKALSVSINGRVAQAAQLATTLNHFAHRSDESKGSFDPAEAVGELVMLMQRFARQRHVELVIEASDAPSSFSSDAFLLQMSLYQILMAMVDSVERSANIGIVIEGDHNELKITIIDPDPLNDDVARDLVRSSNAACVLENLGGCLERGPLAKGCGTTVIKIPSFPAIDDLRNS